MLAFGLLAWVTSFASAETRSLKLHFIHTGEKAEIIYKRNGRYDQSGLQKINRFLRDWRRNEPTRMDPRLLDLVWEAYRTSGSRAYITVISAYRSPATNSMLRSRSRGVAKTSQHMLGKAMDFYLPDVKLKKLRDIGLRMQGGGVGFYPTSGSPFVHMDVGNVRHWPKISRQELARVFPNGKTLHVPSDGKPLPGFDQALAAYKARKGSGNLAIASNSTNRGSTGKSSVGLLAALFGGGGGADEEEESGGSAAIAAVTAPKATVKAAPAAAANAAPEKPAPDIRVVPPELATPAGVAPAQAEEPAEQTPEQIIAALPRRSIPVPGLAPRPQVDVGAEPQDVPFQVVSEDDMPAEPQQVALGIPLPTHRPNYQAPAEQPAEGDAVSALLAMSQPMDDEETASVPMPIARPAEETALIQNARYVVAALPEQRPELAPPSEATPVAIAPAAASNAASELGDDHPFGIAPADTVAAPGNIPVASKGDRMAALASPRAALTARKPGADAASALASGVKTTAKSARPAARDSKPDAKPVVVTAQPQAARWALDANYVKQNPQGTTAPSFAYNIVRTAPREVYTAGFQQEAKVADANRFSGKAVTFLSVARFQTN
jgi:uncharacterized protein YcbK (DUF882 family)